MEILMVAAELAPYARASETADSVAALSRALQQIGHKVTVALPKFAGLEDSGLTVARRLSQLKTATGESVTVYDGQLPSGVGVVLFESATLTARAGVFGDPVVSSGEGAEPSSSPSGGAWVEYPDNAPRFVALCQAATALAEQRAQQGNRFDVVHAHDWPAAAMALLPAPRLPCVFTLHDVRRSASFALDELSKFGLAADADDIERLQLDGRADLVKGALLSAKVVSTISSSLARELKDQEKFSALAMALSEAEVEVHGVNGGVDYAIYNPASDTALPYRFDAESPERKGNCRTALLRELEFELEPERPVVVFASPTFDSESGAESVVNVLPALLKQDVLVVLAGSGGGLSKALGAAKLKRLGNYRWLDTSSPPVQRRILAAADIAICPSRSHHSGHAPRIAQRYGAVPVAIAASGNRDAVVDCDASLTSGNGFLYDDPDQLLACLERALAACRHPNWGALRRRVGRLDLGWERPARRYAQLFRMALTS